MKKEEITKKINGFYNEFNGNIYINNDKLIEIEKEYKELYNKLKVSFLNYPFLKDYKNIYSLKEKNNEKFFILEEKRLKGLLNNVCGKKLDNEQKRVVLSSDANTLVIAGAGSGKSLTIVGKVKYLIYNGISPKDILCISFTNKASLSLKNKLEEELNLEIDVFTFHKLGLKILEKGSINYSIAKSDTLEYVVSEYMNYIILNEGYYMNLVLEYLDIPHRDVKAIYNKYKKSKEFILLKKLVIKFINLFKASCYKRAMFDIFFFENKKIFSKKVRRKNYLFLTLCLKIYDIYEEELSSLYEIDFNDMLIKAREVLDEVELNYKYIIIDEFQDASLARMMLIKKIIEKTNASLLAVGDDFQSIFRFTGCNLDVFLSFERYFKNASVLKLTTTYRNSLELVKSAGNFIMKNDMQIKKNLISLKRMKSPIKIVFTNNYKRAFKKLLGMINTDILVIGRNNNDIESVINNEYKQMDEFLIHEKFKDKVITYLTVHKAKGLEEENVIVINMIDDILGFPNKMKDNMELNFVLSKKESYLYAEERRLFYVALTRTKNKVYLLTNKNKTSIFIKELLLDKNVDTIDL